MKYRLHPNPQWHDKEFPEVFCTANRVQDVLSFLFEVLEPKSCFRAECWHNGDPCWQDSCVEIFIQSPRRGGYYNFECNSNGVALAEFGTQRSNRSQMDDNFYRSFSRKIIVPPKHIHSSVQWSILVEIPLDLIEIERIDSVCGNLYKCASRAMSSHHLMAFPIDTPKPDFHRPEFFRPIIGIESSI